jgi:membrane associated rhomboid family serine protease
MNGDPSLTIGFPRPGRALKAVLICVLAVGILNALLFSWAGQTWERLFAVLSFDPHVVERVRAGQPWRLVGIVGSGLLTNPTSYGHLVFTLLGLYFLAPDLERRWGAGRFLRFLAYAVVAGNLLVMVVDHLAPSTAQERFHPPAVFGASAAIAAIAVAWARDNAHLTVRLFFVVPIRGAWLLWVTIGTCVLDLIFPSGLPEGVVAPFGGIAIGLLLGGSPSPARSLFLRLKLAFLQRRSHSLRVADVLSTRAPRRSRPGAPPLRIVPGGMEDILRKREPPKDKRYLN